MNDAKHFCDTDPGESPASRQRSAGLSLELQSNQAVLDGLLNATVCSLLRAAASQAADATLKPPTPTLRIPLRPTSSPRERSSVIGA